MGRKGALSGSLPATLPNSPHQKLRGSGPSGHNERHICSTESPARLTKRISGHTQRRTEDGVRFGNSYSMASRISSRTASITDESQAHLFKRRLSSLKSPDIGLMSNDYRTHLSQLYCTIP